MSFYDRYLTESLKDPGFEEAWKDTELEYILARNIIRKRNHLCLSQNDLAAKMNTKQSVISRIESGNQNMTLKSLKQLAEVLQTSVPSLMIDFDEELDEDTEETDKKKYKLLKA